MAITLPLPVRIAAGVLATGLDRLRQLPQDLPTLPVTVAGQAVRASMRVQQEIAQLAGRGDELLSGITSRPTEHPAWARFDDEDGDAGTLQDRPSDTGAPSDPGPDTTVVDADPGGDGTAGAEPDPDHDGAASRRPVRGRGTAARPAPRRSSPPSRGARSRAAGRRTQAATTAPETPDAPPATAGAGVDAAPDDRPRPASATGDPADMPGYDQLRPAQVRARLRGLDAAAVSRLLEHEQRGAARAPFLTLLANRLTTLHAGHQQDPEA